MEIYAPFGLRPAYKEGGTPVSTQVVGTILSTYATTIYQYSPVKIGADGTLQLAADGDAFVGSFAGCEYQQSGSPQLPRVVSNFWPAGTTATDIVAYYTRDPYITYEIQANGPVVQTNVGNQADLTASTGGSTTTGNSAAALDAASLTGGAEAKQVRVVGFSDEIDNNILDSATNLYTIVQVQISDHQYVATRNAF